MSKTARIWALLLSASIASSWAQTRYLISTIAGSDATGENGPATQALVLYPLSVAADNRGNVYIAENHGNRVRKVAPDGTITTVACSGASGDYAGDGGPATSAICGEPTGVVVDGAGTLYFSDYFNTVRKVTTDGKIARVAGNGDFVFGGDGGPATAASLNNPGGLAVDAAGSLYIADSGNNRIRRVTPDGKIDTVAGTGDCGFSGDNGPATQAALCVPLAVAVDAQGRILVADGKNNRIRRFAPGGIITTVAGNGSYGPTGDGGPAVSAGIAYPQGVVVDNKGIIYFSDTYSGRVRAIGTDGKLSTLAGTIPGFGGDGGPATSAQLSYPAGLAIDNRGNVYIADPSSNRVRAVSAASIITTFAGFGHYRGDNVPATSAVLNSPNSVAVDRAGDVFFSDYYNHLMRKVDAHGIITTITGKGGFGTLGDGGVAASAQLEEPTGVAADNIGNLYVADSIANTIRMITPAGNIQKVAGGNLGADNATLQFPQGIDLDAKGNIYVAEAYYNRVMKVAPNGVVSNLIGDGNPQSDGDGGLASSAGVDWPLDVKVAPDGTIYITEFYYQGRLRAISPAGIVRTVGYLPQYPTALAIDPAGNIIVSDPRRIWSFTPSGTRTLIAGGGYGFGGDGGSALNALIKGATGIAVDLQGNIYFCDQDNDRVRKLTPDVPSQLISVSGDQQTGPTGSLLPLPLVVKVLGITGIPFANIPVSYTITSGGGTLTTGQTLSGSDGRAGVALTLPPASGVVKVSVTAAGLPPVQFTETAVATPGSISILSGNHQSGTVATTLPLPLTVSVTDTNKKPLANFAVNFSVTSSSATLNPVSAQTGPDGTASTSVTLGAVAGLVNIAAVAGNLPAAVFNLTATPNIAPQIFSGGIVSAGLSNPPVQTASLNAILSIFGQDFAAAGTRRQVTQSDLANGMIPTNLAGVCVLFGTVRAPVFLVTPGQLNVQTPNVAAPSSGQIQVVTACDTPNAVFSPTAPISVQTASPEFFYAALHPDAGGQFPVAATDAQTGSPLGDPAQLGAGFTLAQPGQLITIYATGLGLTIPAFLAGQLPPTAGQVANITISLDGAPVPSSSIQYAGVAPLNAGLYQLNIALPASLSRGEHTIDMTVAGTRSPTGFISIGN